MKKRFIATGLTLALAITSFVGCGKKEETKANPGDKMTISVMAIGASGQHENEYLTTLLENQFDIKLESHFLLNEEYTKKRALLFSSGNIPDVIYHLDPAYVKSDVSQGFLAELDYECEERTDRQISPPCVISVRGYGKFVYNGVGYQTKKGKLSVKVGIYK